MDAKEKEEQLTNQPSPGIDAEDEADIFYPPEPQEVKIVDRVYKIGSLKLRQMKLLLQLSRIDLKRIDEDSIDKMTRGVSAILGEKDIDFLEDNLDADLIKEIFKKVRLATYAGIPKGRAGKVNPPPGEGI